MNRINVLLEQLAGNNVVRVQVYKGVGVITITDMPKEYSGSSDELHFLNLFGVMCGTITHLNRNDKCESILIQCEFLSTAHKRSAIYNSNENNTSNEVLYDDISSNINETLCKEQIIRLETDSEKYAATYNNNNNNRSNKSKREYDSHSFELLMLSSAYNNMYYETMNEDSATSFTNLLYTIMHSTKPVITFVRETCMLWWAYLVLVSHYCIALNTAKFVFPEIELGIIPPLPALEQLIIKAQLSTTMELLCEECSMSVSKALSVGLVTIILEQNNLHEVVECITHKIASLGLCTPSHAKWAAGNVCDEKINVYKRRSVVERYATLPILLSKIMLKEHELRERLPRHSQMHFTLLQAVRLTIYYLITSESSASTLAKTTRVIGLQKLNKASTYTTITTTFSSSLSKNSSLPSDTLPPFEKFTSKSSETRYAELYRALYDYCLASPQAKASHYIIKAACKKWECEKYIQVQKKFSNKFVDFSGNVTDLPTQVKQADYVTRKFCYNNNNEILGINSKSTNTNAERIDNNHIRISDENRENSTNYNKMVTVNNDYDYDNNNIVRNSLDEFTLCVDDNDDEECVLSHTEMRVFLAGLYQCYAMLEDGYFPHEIDRVLCNVVGCRWGMFELSDIMGIDVISKTRRRLLEENAENTFLPLRDVYSVETELIVSNCLGCKCQKGWYTYSIWKPKSNLITKINNYRTKSKESKSNDSKERKINNSVRSKRCYSQHLISAMILPLHERAWLMKYNKHENLKRSENTDVSKRIVACSKRKSILRREVSEDEIVSRLLFSMYNECAKLVERGIVSHVSEVDCQLVAKYGFPLSRGGLCYYIDKLYTPEEVVSKMRILEKALGKSTFTPICQLVIEMRKMEESLSSCIK